LRGGRRAEGGDRVGGGEERKAGVARVGARIGAGAGGSGTEG